METHTRALAEYSRAGIEGPRKHCRIVVSTQIATPVTGSQTRMNYRRYYLLTKLPLLRRSPYHALSPKRVQQASASITLYRFPAPWFNWIQHLDDTLHAPGLSWGYCS